LVPQRNAISAIGLELADERLNLVQLTRAHPPLISAQASVPYPIDRADLLTSPAALKRFIRKALASAPFRGRKVVTALPASDVRIMTLMYQIRANESEDQAVMRLLQERIGEDLSQFVIDYVPVRSDSVSSDRMAMVILSEQSTVTKHLELLREAGLEVIALEVSPVAIKRLVSTLIGAGEVPQNVLVINSGQHKTYLTMVSGQRLLFDQEVDFGEKSVLEQIAVALDADGDVARELVLRHGVHPGSPGRVVSSAIDETTTNNTVLTIARPHFGNLVAEIRRVIMFASSETRGGAMGHAFLIGSFARWPGADALLATLIDLPVTIPKPFALAADSGGDVDGVPRPELVIAAGLALRGFEQDA
jgi:type IV pilus assembly protein PilM